MKRSRDWDSARAAIEGKCCLVCGDPNVDPAHGWPRSRGGDESEANIWPLCRQHHRLFDIGAIDLLTYLAFPQVSKVMELAAQSTQWRSNGLELARHRLLPSEYRRDDSTPSPAYGRAA